MSSLISDTAQLPRPEQQALELQPPVAVLLERLDDLRARRRLTEQRLGRDAGSDLRRPRRQLAQRERIVGSSESGFAEISTNVVAGGGSSSVLSSVFCARSFNESAGTTIATFRRPRSAASDSRRANSRTSSTRISFDGAVSK